MMNREALVGGGFLVRLENGSMGVEGVPDARRGLKVESALTFQFDGVRMRGTYRLTKRVFAGSDLWYVRPAGSSYAIDGLVEVS